MINSFIKKIKNTSNIFTISAFFILSFTLALLINAHIVIAQTNNISNFSDRLEKSGWDHVPEILEKIVAPTFNNEDYDITNYGAIEGEEILCTEAISKAIAACNKNGGGRVVVPRGTFLTGAIHLKDNVNLHISEGAVLKFSTNPQDYLPVVKAKWEGTELMNYSPLIYAYEKKNIALTGKGLLDGQASNEYWWNWCGSEKFGWKEGMPSYKNTDSRPALLNMGDEGVPVEDRIFGDGHYLRPTFVEFYECENILIEGVTLKDSPFWFIHPVLSRNITIDGITVESQGPNTDGCDPESCSYVLIKNCVFNVGDDCIAIKAGRNNDGRRVNVPSTNFVIKDCKMLDGHGGVVIGSEITGGCWDVYAEDCVMDSPNLDRALRIKSNSKRGSVVRNIYMRNVKVGQVGEAIVKLNLHYDPKEAEGYNYKSVIENIFVENVTSEKSKYALYLDGLDNSKVKNINIINCSFNGVEDGNFLNNVESLITKNFYINGVLQKN